MSLNQDHDWRQSKDLRPFFTGVVNGQGDFCDTMFILIMATVFWSLVMHYWWWKGARAWPLEETESCEDPTVHSPHSSSLSGQSGERREVLRPPKEASWPSICSLPNFTLVKKEWIRFLWRWFLLVRHVDLTSIQGKRFTKFGVLLSWKHFGNSWKLKQCP